MWSFKVVPPASPYLCERVCRRVLLMSFFFKFLETTTKEHIDTLHDVILLGIVWMFLGWDFQDGRNSSVVIFQNMPNIIGNMLIDQNDSNVIPC